MVYISGEGGRNIESQSYLWEKSAGDTQFRQWSQVSVCGQMRARVLSRGARPGKAGDKNQTKFEVGLSLQEET